VDVLFRVSTCVVIVDVCYALDVKPAGRDVCAEQDENLALVKVLEHIIPTVLGQTAVDGLAVYAIKL